MYDKDLYAAYGYQLDESDADYRKALRAWKVSRYTDRQAAYRFVIEARKAGKTRWDTLFYRAVWAIDERPNRSEIYASASMLSEAMDRIVQTLQASGLTFDGALLQLDHIHTGRAQAGHSHWNTFADNVAKAIQLPDRVTLDELNGAIDYAQSISTNARNRMLPNMYDAEVRKRLASLDRALSSLKSIAGRED